jgi:hypothetical protein
MRVAQNLKASNKEKMILALEALIMTTSDLEVLAEVLEVDLEVASVAASVAAL